MKKDRLAFWMVIGAPFVIGAAVEFLPAWLALPLVFVGVMLWLGAFLTLKDRK